MGKDLGVVSLPSWQAPGDEVFVFELAMGLPFAWSSVEGCLGRCHNSHCVDLHLLLLPGLTKVPIDGQPMSIVQDLDDMARKWVQGRGGFGTPTWGASGGDWGVLKQRGLHGEHGP